MNKTLRFHIKGLKPLIPHNNRTVNPRGPITIAMKAITGKPAKQKTEEDIVLLSDLEWEAGLYYEPDIGPYIPGGNFEVGMERAAMKVKKGLKDKIKAGITSNGNWPLIYDGPRDMESLKIDERFRICKPMNVVGKKINRTRPFFKEWECNVELTYDTQEVEEDEVVACFSKLASGVGMCDERPRYGRFEVKGMERL